MLTIGSGLRDPFRREWITEFPINVFVSVFLIWVFKHLRILWILLWLQSLTLPSFVRLIFSVDYIIPVTPFFPVSLSFEVSLPACRLPYFMLSIMPSVGIEGPSTNVQLASFDSVANDHSFKAPKQFLNVPWFTLFYWRSDELAFQYVYAGMLVRRVPVRAREFPEWHFRLLITSSDILRGPGESLQCARTGILSVLWKRFRHVRQDCHVTSGSSWTLGASVILESHCMVHISRPSAW